MSYGACNSCQIDRLDLVKDATSNKFYRLMMSTKHASYDDNCLVSPKVSFVDWMSVNEVLTR